MKAVESVSVVAEDAEIADDVPFFFFNVFPLAEPFSALRFLVSVMVAIVLFRLYAYQCRWSDG